MSTFTHQLAPLELAADSRVLQPPRGPLETVTAESPALSVMTDLSVVRLITIGADVAGNRLRACVFVALAKTLPSRTWLGTLFGAGELADPDRMAILAGRAPSGRAESGPIVCSCFSVGRSTLLRAIRADGLVCVEEIGKALEAGTNCGSCIPELKGLLAQSRADEPVAGPVS